MKISKISAILCLVGMLLVSEIGVEYENTTLSKIKKSPSSFKNMGVKVKVVFNSITENWVPVFTFFSAENFINFAVWGYEQHIWYKKVLLDDYPYFYIRKDRKEAKKIIKAKRYQCFELKGIVKNVYAEKAWIEVEEIKPLTIPCISENVLSLAIKANESFRKNNFIEALYFTEELKNETLPFELDKRIRDIKCFSYLQLNLRKDAIQCYRNLLSLTGEKKYRMVIESLKKYRKEYKKYEDTMFYIRKLKQLIGEKSAEVASLKKEIEKLKKIVNVANVNSVNGFKTQGLKNNVVNTAILNVSSMCDKIKISGRRVVDRRLDREEISAMLENKEKCFKTHREYINIVQVKDVITDYKVNINNNVNTFRIPRRILERRLDREEFEYLLTLSKKQL